MTDLAKILKDMVAQYGESVLSDHKRVNSVLSDLARDVPKPKKNAFIKCLEHGFADTLKDAPENERNNCKQQLAQKLHEEEGLVLDLCAETLDLLEKVLFGKTKEAPKKIICKNCGKELQKEWKTCPFCSVGVPSQEENHKVSSAISSASGNGGHGVKPINQISRSQNQQSRSVTQTYSLKKKRSVKVFAGIFIALLVVFSLILIITEIEKNNFAIVNDPYTTQTRIIAYNGSAKNVKIPSRIQGKTVIRIESYAFSFNREPLTSVKIPNSVLNISNRAFSGYPPTKITIGANVNIFIPNNAVRDEEFNFANFYNSHGRQAGTYILSKGTWRRK